MKKFKKILFIILINLLILSCGYEPMFKNLKNLNFVLTIENFSGDKELNRLINSRLKNYSVNEVGVKNYIVSYNSNYQKIIIAKDTKGNASEYTIQIEVKFIITSGELKKEFSYTESFNMKSINDRLEEQDYEKTIRDSLIKIIIRKLILQLSQINDNKIL
tara:strand:- start:668 stop:1150 length:483 start_codon:yes stop_codon:yes gene_type:complete